MKQKNDQVLGLKQTQKLSPQQVLEVRLLELSTEELLQRIETEVLENEALEKGAEEDGASSEELETEADPEGLDVTEDVLGDPEDDGMDTPSGAVMDPTGWQIRNEKTFHDLLMEQVGELNLTEDQIPIMQYLIGSLEEDGLLHKDLQRIADELYFNAGTQIPMEELETCLHLLQQFDPAGIGGRNLQECLLLQVKRLPPDSTKPLLLRVLNEQFDNLLSNRWDRIAEQLELDKEMTERLRKEVKRLNPRPGRSLYADDGGSNTLMPDFLLTVE
ncbi:MAG: RNA polymerase sigma-54 factor, partial [Bacteroidaceae bacterium]|nr:RNA polymerase sigma-54 factor [Bacteroidaceae bacterium]